MVSGKVQHCTPASKTVQSIMVPAGFSTAATNNKKKKKLQKLKEQITSAFLPLQLALSEALFSKGCSNVLLKYAKSILLVTTSGFCVSREKKSRSKNQITLSFCFTNTPHTCDTDMILRLDFRKDTQHNRKKGKSFCKRPVTTHLNIPLCLRRGGGKSSHVTLALLQTCRHPFPALARVPFV